MKIPKYIYEWMVLTAHYSYKAAELNRKVAEWLERHGVDVDALSDGSGCGFEELMYGLIAAPNVYCSEKSSFLMT